MTSTPQHTNHRPQRTQPPARRGTIVILAVGILAVLAVASLSYMTVVRLDRSSAAAYATEANFRQQVGAASLHIRSLLAADLFGNKVVTGSVPERINLNQIWPRAFEDGEFRDYPSVDGGWLENPSEPTTPTDPTNPLHASWILNFDFGQNRYPAAPADDAWLASQTPVDTDGNGFWDTWPQITNLRSGWLYRPDPVNAGNPGFWMRDHGRYVDIAEWLANTQSDPFSTTLGRGDPGLDNNRFDTSAAYSTQYGEDNLSDIGANDTGTGGPNLGVDDILGAGGIYGTDLEVYEFQMSRLQEFLDGSTANVDEDFGTAAANPENIDGRMWADTDGDGRADARWQELDALGELFGYRWLIAARIIDNSAMINVNSSLEWQFPMDSTSVGMGRTPADIDLYRLLRRSNSTAPDPVTFQPIGHPDVIANSQLSAAHIQSIWNNHRTAGWGLPQAFLEIDLEYRNPTVTGGSWTPLAPLDPAPMISLDPLGARERELFWRTAGDAPQRRSTLSAIPVPIGDEIDLRARFGSNYVPFTSKIEDRLEQIDDPSNPAGWLPGQPAPGGTAEPYPNQNSLGPMRSKEDGRDIRTYSLSALTPQQDFVGDYFQHNKIARIMSDIRRHMTTINGVSNVSPIPVLNTLLGSGFEDLYINEKIRLDDPDLIRDPVADAAVLASDEFKIPIKDFVNRSFGAFLWALAPLATDKPLTSDFVVGDTGMNANDLDYSYGGGADGPAAAMMPMVNSAYPVLRAASLAVNLADALDNDGGLEESPTIARFAPPMGVGGGPSLPPPVLDPDDRDFALTKSFSHGVIGADVLTAALDEQYVGTPSNGVTLIGLDRQPFLMEAVTMAVLEDSRSPMAGNPIAEVDVTNVDDHVVSLMMFELGNPWPNPIDASDYMIRLSSSSSPMPSMDFLFALDTFDTSGAASDAIISPGSSKVFMVVFDQDVSSLPAHFSSVRQQFLDELIDVALPARGLVLGGELARLDPGAPNTVLPLAGNGAVPYHVYSGSGIPGTVQLLYRDPAQDKLYLVDRMTGGSDEFPWPASVTPGFTMFPNNPPQVLGSGRAVFTSSLRRPKGQPLATGGFPSYVIERSAENMIVPGIDWWQWTLGPMAGDIQDPLTNPGTTPEDVPAPGLAPTDLFTNSGVLTDMPSMQFFVPNGPFRSVAELHMLNMFTHMYVHDSNNAYESDTSNLNSALRNAHDATATGPNSWRTISEQLGQDANWFYDGAAGNVNPYLGVLDPSRYILGGDLAATPPTADPDRPWPDDLRIPLALRVFDCFTVWNGGEALVQGRINLNTAPLEVLESMPFFAPEFPVSTNFVGGPTTDLPAGAAGLNRARLVKDYRDLPVGSAFDIATPDARSSETTLGGLRTGTPFGPTSPQNAPGLINVGELLAIADWSSGDGNPGATGLPSGYSDFYQLGTDGDSNDGAPLSLRYAQGVYTPFSVSADFNEFGAYTGRNDYPAATFDPVDDAEERLALARSALDIAAARSDVFTAYFVLRAYNPEQIEVIQTSGIGDPVLLSQLLDEQGNPNPSPGLRPIYESRWMGVFDRSVVTRPNQKPRVLLLVELPID